MTNFGMGNSIMTLVVKIDAKLRVISQLWFDQQKVYTSYQMDIFMDLIKANQP